MQNHNHQQQQHHQPQTADQQELHRLRQELRSLHETNTELLTDLQVQQAESDFLQKQQQEESNAKIKQLENQLRIAQKESRQAQTLLKKQQQQQQLHKRQRVEEASALLQRVPQAQGVQPQAPGQAPAVTTTYPQNSNQAQEEQEATTKRSISLSPHNHPSSLQAQQPFSFSSTEGQRLARALLVQCPPLHSTTKEQEDAVTMQTLQSICTASDDKNSFYYKSEFSVVLYVMQQLLALVQTQTNSKNTHAWNLVQTALMLSPTSQRKVGNIILNDKQKSSRTSRIRIRSSQAIQTLSAPQLQSAFWKAGSSKEQCEIPHGDATRICKGFFQLLLKSIPKSSTPAVNILTLLIQASPSPVWYSKCHDTVLQVILTLPKSKTLISGPLVHLHSTILSSASSTQRHEFLQNHAAAMTKVLMSTLEQLLKKVQKSNDETTNYIGWYCDVVQWWHRTLLVDAEGLKVVRHQFWKPPLVDFCVRHFHTLTVLSKSKDTANDLMDPPIILAPCIAQWIRVMYAILERVQDHQQTNPPMDSGLSPLSFRSLLLHKMELYTSACAMVLTDPRSEFLSLELQSMLQTQLKELSLDEEEYEEYVMKHQLQQDQAKQRK